MPDVVLNLSNNTVQVVVSGSELVQPLVDAAVGAVASQIAADAATAQNAAETAAGLAGVTDIFDTRAAADAALSGVPADAHVIVMVDEGRDDRKTLYQKVSGAYVFVADLNTVTDLQAPGDAILLGGGEPVSAPPAPVSAVDAGAGLLGAGTYRYAVYEQHNGRTALGAYEEVTLAAGRKALITCETIREGATGRTLCRTKAGGADFYVLHHFGGDQGYHQNRFLDDVPDADLVELVPEPGVNLSRSYQQRLFPDVSYLHSNPDNMAPHKDLTILRANGDDERQGVDSYGPIYVRARSSANLKTLKVGQRGRVDSYHYVARVTDDDGLGEGGSPFSDVLKITNEGWVSMGRDSVDPVTLLDLWSPVEIDDILGDAPLPAFIRSVDGPGHISGLDLGIGQTAPPKGRVAVVKTADGSYLLFGTSSNYAEGITSARVVIDFNGNLGINTGTNYGGVGLPGVQTVKADGARPMSIWLNAAGHTKARVSADGTAVELYNTGEADPLNFERGLISWSGGAFEVGTDAAGTGAARHLRLHASASLFMAPGQVDRWTFDGTDLDPLNDGLSDIGDPTHRVRRVNAELVVKRTYALADLPTPTSILKGAEALVEFGAGASLVLIPARCDGAGWVFEEVTLQNAVAASVTGTTAETTLATITIPGGLLGPNGQFEIETLWSYTSSANLKTFNTKFDGVGIHTLGTNTNGQVSMTAHQRVANRNSQSSQVMHRSSTVNYFAMITSAVTTSTVDTSVDKNLTISGVLASAGETITLESWVLRLRRKG